MNFPRRLSFFLFGAFLGILLICIFFGKRAFFEGYFPNKRVLNSIKKKEIIFEFKKSELAPDLELYHDLNFIKNTLLEKGEIDFSKSHSRKKPFPIYLIVYRKSKENKPLHFYIENQNTKAFIKSIDKNH